MGKLLPGITVAFENSKGGCGKSTLTAVFAGFLHTYGKEQGLSIGVVDADDVQNSIGNMRFAEKEDSSNEEYEIMNIPTSDLPERMNFLKESFDIILIDFPGNLKQEGVITSLGLIDVIIIPFEPNDISISATLEFYSEYKKILELREEEGLKTIVRGLPNRVTPNLKEYKDLIARQNELPFELLKNHVRESKVDFQRNITTLTEYYSNDANDTCDEILQLIQDLI